jgi:hypothetical protein
LASAESASAPWHTVVNFQESQKLLGDFKNTPTMKINSTMKKVRKETTSRKAKGHV